jgi:Fe-S-cluster containining protein
LSTLPKYPKVKCARCGDCCRIPVVPVTHRDVARLVKHTGLPVGKLVRFCPSSEMAYDEDSGLWIKFKSAKRAMVLRKRGERCIFQTPERACSAYAARPQTCRTFPYSMEFDGRKVTEITLNEVMKCNAIKCTKGCIDIDTVVANVKKENREDSEYHKLVKQWNLSRYTGTVKDFLKFVGL